MADGPTKINVLRPSPCVLDVLKDGLAAHVSNYIRDGGSRHFPTEDAQNDAKAWLAHVFDAAGIEER